MSHSRRDWDKRAEEWENGLREDPERLRTSNARIAGAAKFLRDRGLLTSEQDVIDIGCGPGRFVAEFAKTCRTATGTDLSVNMTAFGQKFCEEQGLKNTSFVDCDFNSVDIDEMNWRGRFDLVFTSITPVVGRTEGFLKALSMSRGWFYNSSYISVNEYLLSEVSRELTGEEPRILWDGLSFYCMLNMLWLNGHCPEITYYHEEGEETFTDIEALADRYAPRVYGKAPTNSDLGRVAECLSSRLKDGVLKTKSRKSYACMLVDINRKYERNYDFK